MKKRVLIVDDVEMNREMLYEILKDEYYVIQAENGIQALEYIEDESNEIAVVLLDLVMPGLDGFGVLEEMNKKNLQEKIPVLVISGDNYSETEEKCFDYGISDFVSKPYYDNVVKKRIKNLVDLFQHKNRLEEKVVEQNIILKEQNILLMEQTEKLKQNNIEIIDVLGTVVESRNLESGEHIKRVKGFSKILAEKLMELYPEYGLTKENVEMISVASALHDIGKIAIPDNVLLKPGRLTDEEFECMKSHSVKGCEILVNIKDIWDGEYSRLSYEICRHHHERYDGRGYPDGLSGEDIPISAQIVSVADVYDALVSERVYKKAFSKEEAFNMILNGECGVFSPKLLRCFQESRERLEKLADSNKEKFT